MVSLGKRVTFLTIPQSETTKQQQKSEFSFTHQHCRMVQV